MKGGGFLAADTGDEADTAPRHDGTAAAGDSHLAALCFCLGGGARTRLHGEPSS